jgi:integrase
LDELVRNAGAKAKLPPGVCLYTLRHSFITQAITDGMTTLDVARLCGTSFGMIEKHYGHLVADAARKWLAAVTMLCPSSMDACFASLTEVRLRYLFK